MIILALSILPFIHYSLHAYCVPGSLPGAGDPGMGPAFMELTVQFKEWIKKIQRSLRYLSCDSSPWWAWPALCGWKRCPAKVMLELRLKDESVVASWVCGRKLKEHSRPWDEKMYGVSVGGKDLQTLKSVRSECWSSFLLLYNKPA